MGDVHGEALAREAVRQYVGQPFLVVHQQQPHARESGVRA
jgi:hypothetical protein